MELVTCLDESGWVTKVNDWLENRIRCYSALRVFLPAGSTPLPLYKFWEANHPSYLKAMTFLQVDEVIGDKKVFRPFFQETLPSYEKQFEFIENGDGGAEVGLLGLGLNGHVAFHEPGLSLDFYSGCVPLQASTTDRLGLSAGTWGVTYGVGAFLRTQSLALIVRGVEKRNILKQVLAQDQKLPASALMSHQDVTIFCDFQV